MKLNICIPVALFLLFSACTKTPAKDTDKTPGPGQEVENNSPVAQDQSVTVNANSTVEILLQASDPDGDALSFDIVDPPLHGTLGAIAGNAVAYTPTSGYTGTDAFAFRANDGTVDSNTATVSITILPVNQPPVASSGAVSTEEGTPIEIVLVATDADGDSLTYDIVDSPIYGDLSEIFENTVTYTPLSGYFGSDSFTFLASDGTLSSNVATVNITITEVVPPTADAGDDQLAVVGLRVHLVGHGTDIDDAELTYAWTQTAGPAATLDDPTAQEPSFTARFAGAYEFSLVTNNGAKNSAPASTTVFVYDIAANDHSLLVKPNGTLWAWGANSYGQQGNGTTARERIARPAALGSTWRAVATGAEHSVALKNDNTVWAWGRNNHGQLGNGAVSGTDPNPEPQAVCQTGDVPCTTPLGNIIAVAAGAQHSLALAQDGTVWAWGNGGSGRLGVDLAQSPAPVQVCASGDEPCSTPLGDIVAIDAGEAHSIAMDSSGTVWAFGHNGFGQLGNNDTSHSPVPQKVCAVEDSECATDLVAEGIHAAYRGNLALLSDGTVAAWGENGNGELGVGEAGGDPARTPIRVCLSAEGSCSEPLANIALAQAHEHALAVGADGTLWGWGKSTHGELASAPSTANPEVKQIGSGIHWVGAFAGRNHTLALDAAGTLWAWGDNRLGQVGDGTAWADTPTQVLGSDGVAYDNDWQAAAAGQFFSVALKTDGTVWAWGHNDRGQLGVGDTSPRASATQVCVSGDTPCTTPLNDITAISAGIRHVLARAADGTVWAWGGNSTNYQLGDGTIIDRHSPVQVCATFGGGVCTALFEDAGEVAAGALHSLARKTDGSVWGWGYGGNGQLGLGVSGGGAKYTTPRQVCGESNCDTYLAGAVAIAAGGDHSLAILDDGSLWGWGYNWFGQVGNGSSENNQVRPQREASQSNAWTHIAAGYDHSLALQEDGGGAVSVWAWGANMHGAIGDASTEGRSSPVQMCADSDCTAYLTAAQSLGGGSQFSSVVMADGSLWSTGQNSSGELGDGSTERSLTPVQDATATLTWTSVASSLSSHTLAVRDDGTLWAWGSNSHSQLGAYATGGARVEDPTPVAGF